MKTRILAVLALAIAALANIANAQTTPSAFKSLQPFERFAKGAGEGVAYEYKDRTKAQFVALLRDKGLAKKEMRIGCDVLVQQMVEGHKSLNLSFEGCGGAAKAIESDSDFAVVACRDEMFQGSNFLTVTNEDGTAFGIWHRKCYQGEKVLVYKNEPLASMWCLNAVITVSPAPSVAKEPSPAEKKTPPVARGPVLGCPDVWVLEVANWDNKAFYLPGIERTHAQEKFHVVFVNVQHVSRTHGAQLREAYSKGEIIHSKIPRNFRVSLIMTEEARNGNTTITQEKFYRDIVVVGSREVAFPVADIEQWDAIRVIAADGEEVLSPPLFAETGFHEMRFFNKMPGTKHGEWDNPKQKPCYKTEHWIEQPQIVQKQ